MTYCPRCATPLERRQRHGQERSVCPRCGFVDYHNPLPVAACVAEHADGAIVLIRRRFEPGRGLWALPAGFIEHAEAPAVAAVREVAEETGLVVAVAALIGVYPYVERDGGGSGIVIAYAGRVVGGQAAAADDALEVAHFAPSDLPDDLAFSTHRSALGDWLAGRGLPRPAGWVGEVTP